MREVSGNSILWILGAIMLVLVAGIGWCGFEAWRSIAAGRPSFGMPWTIFVVVQALLLSAVVTVFRIRLRIAPAQISLTRTEVPLGGEVGVTWRQRFNRRARARKAVIKLVFEELAVEGKSVYGEETVVQQLEQAGRDYEAGEDLTFSGRLRVPPTGMHSFKADGNELSWSIQSLLQVEGWPDDSSSRKLTVQPRIER